MVHTRTPALALGLVLCHLTIVAAVSLEIKALRRTTQDRRAPVRARMQRSENSPFPQAKLRGQRPSTFFDASLDASDDNDGSRSVVENVGNIRWTTDVDFAGQEYTLLLDTGSRDLWVDMSRTKPQFEDTRIPLSLRYGDGSYGVDGTIGIADVQLGSKMISKQAFLAATSNTISKTTELDVDGLLGLQFDLSSNSNVGKAMKKKLGDNTTRGRTLLENIFRQNESLPNFIAFDLGRTDDFEETDGGFFTIGEHSPKADPEDLEGIEERSVFIEQYPKGSPSWTALVDKITVDGVAVELRSILKGTPKGKVVALLDTGAPRSVMSESIRDGIYELIGGSGQLETAEGEPGRWHVPCLSKASVVVTLGGQEFPMHPLDLSEITTATSGNKRRTRCLSSMRPSPASRWKNKNYEMILGADFLMNVYAMFDFGDFQKGGKLGPPYMKLHAQTNVEEAARQVATIRGEHLKDLDPELIPKPGPRKPKQMNADSATFPDLSLGGFLSTENGGVLRKYAVAALALVTLNVVLGVMMAIGGVMLYHRRAKVPKKRDYAPQFLFNAAD